MDGRVETICEHKHKKNVLYLMQRDHRIQNNYSMVLAYNLAKQSNTYLFLGCNIEKIKKNDSQHAFICEGFIEMEKEAKKLGLPLCIIHDLQQFVKDKDIDCVVSEFSPIREALEYQNEIKEICKNKIAYYTCDSHNIVPCKQLNEYCKSSRGIKTRLYKKWPNYFTDIDPIEKYEKNFESKMKDLCKKNNENAYCELKYYKPNVQNKTKYKGGRSEGLKILQDFLDNKFENFKKLRNNVDHDCLTNLSPWVHSGQLSTLEIIKITNEKHDFDNENFEDLLNEVFVWKETAEHFCYHEKNYDNMKGASSWAENTLHDHKNDNKKTIYSFEQLEKAQTNDDEWNAGLKEMILTGKMHTYVKIYWSKKLLEFTATPEEAIDYAVKLNDKYSIDGNGPVEYAWIMYAICGVMDRGYGEQDFTGKVRSLQSIKGKKYTQKWKDCKI